jgi:hypothetical protein
MSPVVILGIVAAFLLLSRKSGGAITTPEGGTPGGTIPSRDGPRRAPPARPREFESDAERRAYLDRYNEWALATGNPVQSYDQMFGTSSDSQTWYAGAVQTGGGLIEQGVTVVTDFGSAMYNWATGSGKAAAGK